MRVDFVCEICGKQGHRCYALGKVHHIIPVRYGGQREPHNLVVLCKSCHTLVEYQQKQIYDIIPDWDVVQVLVRERLYCL